MKEHLLVVACISPNGDSDFFFCKVICTQDQYDVGDHYYTAERAAYAQGYGGPMVCFDELDKPMRAGLKDLFVWESATMYPCLVQEN